VTVTDSPEAAIAVYVHRLAGRPVEPHEAILSSQLLESIAAVQLIDYIERSFAVVIDDDDLVLANFDSVDAIAALVRAKCRVP